MVAPVGAAPVSDKSSGVAVVVWRRMTTAPRCALSDNGKTPFAKAIIPIRLARAPLPPITAESALDAVFDVPVTADELPEATLDWPDKTDA